MFARKAAARELNVDEDIPHLRSSSGSNNDDNTTLLSLYGLFLGMLRNIAHAQCVTSLECLLYAAGLCKESMEGLDSVVFVDAAVRAVRAEESQSKTHTMGRSESVGRGGDGVGDCGSGSVFVFGPIKGHAADLCHQLLNILPACPDSGKHEENELRALLAPFNFVFLGDYIDGGLYSIETLTVVLLLHALFERVFHQDNNNSSNAGTKVVLLKGRHEILMPCPRSWTGGGAAAATTAEDDAACDVLQTGRFDEQVKLRCERFVKTRAWREKRKAGSVFALPSDIIERLEGAPGVAEEAGKENGVKVILEHTEECVRIVFSAMPVAAVVNRRYFCVCGGISPSLRTIDSMSSVNRLLLSPCADTVARSLSRKHKKATMMDKTPRGEDDEEEIDEEKSDGNDVVTDAMRERVAEDLVDLILSDPMDDDDEFVLGCNSNSGVRRMPRQEEEDVEDEDEDDGTSRVQFAPNTERKVGYIYSYNAACNFLHRNGLRSIVRANAYAWHRNIDVDSATMSDCNSCGRPWHFQYSPYDPGYRLYASWTPTSPAASSSADPSETCTTYPSVISLFSAPHYCGQCCAANKNKGAFLVIRSLKQEAEEGGEPKEEDDDDDVLEIRQFDPNKRRPVQLPGTTAAATAFGWGHTLLVNKLRDALTTMLHSDIEHAPQDEEPHQATSGGVSSPQQRPVMYRERSVNSGFLAARNGRSGGGRASIHDGARLMSSGGRGQRKAATEAENPCAEALGPFVDASTREIDFRDLWKSLFTNCDDYAERLQAQDGRRRRRFDADALSDIIRQHHHPFRDDENDEIGTSTPASSQPSSAWSASAIDSLAAVDKLLLRYQPPTSSKAGPRQHCTAARCDTVARFSRLLTQVGASRQQQGGRGGDGEEEKGAASTTDPSSLASLLLRQEEELDHQEGWAAGRGGEQQQQREQEGAGTQLEEVLRDLCGMCEDTALLAEERLVEKDNSAHEQEADEQVLSSPGR